MKRRAYSLITFTLLFVGLAPSAAPEPPKCVVRSGVSGGPAILVNGRPYSPLMFVGNNQFGRDDVLLVELREAAEAGIPFFSFMVNLDWSWTPEKAAEVVDTFCAAHPEGYFYIRVWVGPNGEWMKAHPDECIVKADGERLRWVSPSSVVWREAAADMLRSRIREIVEGPHGDRFIGVCPANMQTGEWFYRFNNEFMDYSPANLSAFRGWLKKTYRNKRGLRKAWNDTEVTFDTAAFPSAEFREQAAWGPFRDPALHAPAMDMQRFQSEMVADTVAYFARVVKEATHGRALAGAFFGYTMELNNNGPRALAHSGHLAFSRLLECPDVDLIHAPYSYFERSLGEPGHLHLPVDSVALHGKLAVLEEDTYTHLASPPGEGILAPGWNEHTTSLTETLDITRRNFGNFFTHRCGLWVFDLLSDGRWRGNDFWNSTVLMRRMAAELRSDPLFRPEVAVVIDEDAVHLMRANTRPYLLHALSFWRSEWDRVGTPVGYYLQSDLSKLPDSVRVLVLANALSLDEAQRRALRRFLGQGRTVIWTYAPDIVGPDGPDPARIAEATGIDVEARFDDVAMTIQSEVTGERCAIGPQSWQPRFVVTAEDVEVLATYADTGEVSAAARPLHGGVSVYAATPRLPVGLLRVLCERSGAHLYRDGAGMTGVFGPYLIAHTDEPGEYQFAWPTVCGTVERVVPTRSSTAPRAPFASATNTWGDTLPGKTTAIYRVTP